MFTGIIEELGEVSKISKRGSVSVLEIEAEKVLEDVKVGDSIAVNGVCLTVIKQLNNTVNFEVMQETFQLTNLGRLKIGERVNLERALKVGDRLSGHFVSGHIDCIGVIRSKTYRQDNLCFEIAAPVKFMKYIVAKGSVALDGISLTVADKKSATFTVYIIPYTVENTSLNFKGPSSKVNLEFDILAKYTKVV